MSFSGETKNMLCAVRVKKRCCREAMLYGMLLFSAAYRSGGVRTVTENERTSQTLLRLLAEQSVKAALTLSEKKTKAGEPYSSYRITVTAKEDLERLSERFGQPEEADFGRVLVCPECGRHFVRGAFLSAGSISDPKSGFHLDMTTRTEALGQAFADFLTGEGLSPKRSVRKKQQVIYFKGSEAIGDFLTYIGAPRAALSVIDMSIYREIRNQENRHSNCDTANISRSTDSAARCRRAIRRLREDGRFERLEEELKITAALREQYPEYSLQELAAAHTPPITKSGVHHRIARLMALAEAEAEK